MRRAARIIFHMLAATIAWADALVVDSLAQDYGQHVSSRWGNLELDG
jgi:hypothetical protein